MNSLVPVLPTKSCGLRRLMLRSLQTLCLLTFIGGQIVGAQGSVRTGSTLRNLNLRAAPSLEAQVRITLPEGASFTLLESSGEWIRVRAGSDEGWLYSPFVRLAPPRAVGTGPTAVNAPTGAGNSVGGPDVASPASDWSGVTLESLNLRSGPSTNNSRIVLLPPRMRLEIFEQRGDWLRVRASGSEGWVSGEYVRITSSPLQNSGVEPPEAAVQIPSSAPGTNERIRELTTENSRLATELAESTARLVQADRERAALRDERDQLRSSLEALQTELVATRSALVEAAQATGENIDAQSELGAVREGLERAQRRIETLEQQITGLEQARNDLESRLETSASTAQRLEAETEVERARQTQLQQDLQAATAARDEANSRIAMLTGRIQELETEKETADTAGTDLRSELARLRTERELADAEATRLTSELERERAATEQAEARLATLQGEVDLLRGAAENQVDETDQLEQARQDLNRLIAERAAQEETLVESSAREDQLRGQLRTVGAELDAARLDVNRAVVALEELQAENVRLRRELEDRPGSMASTTRPADRGASRTPGDAALPFEPLVPAQSPTEVAEAPDEAETSPLEPLVSGPASPAEAAPAPPAEPAPEPEAVDPVIAASERVEAWRAAWSGADVDGYLSSYVDGYQPDPNTTHFAWRTLRRQRLTAPAFIEVRLGTLQVVSRGEDRVVLRFEQIYESNNFSDRVMKTLTLVRTEDGDWRIETETSSPL